MIYLTLGDAIRKGVPLYSQIHDNKPPLLYLMAAISGSLFVFKAVLALWHIITVFIFWKLAEALYPKNKKFQIAATSVFALLTTIPLLEGNIVNAELFMIGPIILSFYILLTKKLSFKTLFVSGMVFSVGALFKIPAIFDIPTIVVLWIVSLKKFSKESLLGILKNTLFLSLGVLTPILATCFWFFLNGALSEYIKAAFLQNVGYLSTWRPSDVQKPFLIKNAPLLIRSGIVFIGVLVLFLKRNLLSKEFIFSTLWLLFSLFAVTLSERPYPHYLIQSVGPISLLVGTLFAMQNFEQLLAIIPLSLASFVPYYYHFWHYPTFSYYSKFVRFIDKNTSKDEYLKTFGQYTQRNYKIASFIVSNTKPSEKIFVWGDTSTIYALSKRLPPIKFVADYHIKDFANKELLFSQMSNNLPSYIIILPEAEKLEELDAIIKNNYAPIENIEGATIMKLLGSKVRALIKYYSF